MYGISNKSRFFPFGAHARGTHVARAWNVRNRSTRVDIHDLSIREKNHDFFLIAEMQKTLKLRKALKITPKRPRKIKRLKLKTR